VVSAYGEPRASVRLSSCAKETTRCRDRDPSGSKRSPPNLDQSEVRVTGGGAPAGQRLNLPLFHAGT